MFHYQISLSICINHFKLHHLQLCHFNKLSLIYTPTSFFFGQNIQN